MSGRERDEKAFVNPVLWDVQVRRRVEQCRSKSDTLTTGSTDVPLWSGCPRDPVRADGGGVGIAPGLHTVPFFPQCATVSPVSVVKSHPLSFQLGILEL